ncbi:MAG: response regulator [Planctomycetota bacterium]
MSGFSVLLLDDEEDFLLSCGTWFSRRGYQVMMAHHPQDALEAAANRHFDAAVVDGSFAEMDGAAFRALLSDTCNAPVIVVSGDAERDSIRAALFSGASRYLIKPVSLREIEAAVREAIADRTLDEALPAR